MWHFTSPDDRAVVRGQLAGFAEIGQVEPGHVLFGENWAVPSSKAGTVEALRAVRDDLGGELVG